MCGIFGIISPEHPGGHHELAKSMAGILRHRGPDSHGIWQAPDKGVTLGHVRLAIQDLSPLGHQPMRSNSKRYTISFNGEIYNFRRVRSELEQLGGKFEGHSDTEVLLVAIEHFGLEHTLTKLEGMFAFALWDAQESELILCRDRIGEKPLYYGWNEGCFVFASELNAIEKVCNNLSIDHQALSNYFYYGYVPAPNSLYQGIFKLYPGTRLVIPVKSKVAMREKFSPFPNSSQGSPQIYWSVEGAVQRGVKAQYGSPIDAANALDKLLREVIGDQSIADVPLGAFLSGGVDSTTVVAMMQQVNERATKTFTVGFENKEFNEAGHAKEIAKHLGTEHTELYVGNNDCLDLVPKVSSLYDEPIGDSSQVPTFLVSQMAREHVTVCLSGDAGDELFAGYNRYIWTDKIWRKVGALPLPIRKICSAMLRSLPISLWNSAYRGFAALSGTGGSQNNVGLKVQKLAQLLRCGDVSEAYCYLVSYWQPDDFPLLKPDLINVDVFQTTPDQISNLIDRAMYWDQLSYLPGDNLTKVDRASMAESLETRLPLLNHRMIEFAWRVPLAMKIREGQSKWLMRQVLYQYVPRHLIERPKMGFSVPITQWLRGPLKEWASALINEADEGLFERNRIQKVWSQHQSGHYDHGNRLWALLMFLDWQHVRRF